MSTQEPTDLDWVQLREEMASGQHIETPAEKFARKFMERPLIPIGCAATTGALGYGLWCFRQGKSKRSQQMMRLRIFAQAFTVTAIVIGVVTAGKTSK